MIAKKLIREIFFIYMTTASLHWCTTNLYVKLCTPLTFSGILKTALLSQSPTCQLLTNTNTATMTIMNNTVASAVSWMMVRFTVYQRSLMAA